MDPITLTIGIVAGVGTLIGGAAVGKHVSRAMRGYGKTGLPSIRDVASGIKTEPRGWHNPFDGRIP